jgi:hydroxyacyl-ACP dehydratase HTD2-like protein with hotdog domain
MQAYEDSGLPTDWKSLLEDREALNTSVNTSHEKHEENINNLEGRISDRERTYADKQLSKYRDLEYQRNRQRVSEIFNLVERHKADIDRLLQSNAAAHASSKEEEM